MYHQAIKKLFPLLLLPVLLFLLSGCVTAGPPAYQYSQDVGRLFQPPPTLLPDHTYYYRGSPSLPDAVIAIDNKFTLKSKVWGKVDITRKMLDNWAFEFDTYLGWWNCPYRGAKLFAPDGRQVGVGYSRWTFSVIKLLGPNEITVYPPQPLGSCRRQDILDDR